ncbi:MAG: hypothetical protein JNK58_06295 [Phycisphaerae bacterium]|nr:hypothetical protein [Phycisphaerae bacterium]
MRLKAMVLIASGAAVSVGLLVVRQQRLQAVYEMTRSLERGSIHDRDLWMLRAQIAESIRPERVVRMAATLGPMRPIPREICQPAPGIKTPSKREQNLTRAER